MVATVGVLALQGGVEEHLRILDGLGVATRRVRVPRDLEGLDGLVIPGGESSVIDKLARTARVPMTWGELPDDAADLLVTPDVAAAQTVIVPR